MYSLMFKVTVRHLGNIFDRFLSYSLRRRLKLRPYEATASNRSAVPSVSSCEASGSFIFTTFILQNKANVHISQEVRQIVNDALTFSPAVNAKHRQDITPFYINWGVKELHLYHRALQDFV